MFGVDCYEAILPCEELSDVLARSSVDTSRGLVTSAILASYSEVFTGVLWYRCLIENCESLTQGLKWE